MMGAAASCMSRDTMGSFRVGKALHVVHCKPCRRTIHQRGPDRPRRGRKETFENGLTQAVSSGAMASGSSTASVALFCQ